MTNNSPRIVESAPETIIPKIEKETNHIAALFLETSAIEGYLSSFISLVGKLISNNKNAPHKDVEKNVDKMPAIQLLNINNELGTIDNDLYTEISKFLEKRNKIAHSLIGVDLHSLNKEMEIKNLVKEGLQLCKKISALHTELLYKLTEDAYFIKQPETEIVKSTETGVIEQNPYI